MGREYDLDLPSRNRIFDFIVKFKREHGGNSPTSREIADGAEISSTSVVNYHLEMLVEEGRIRVERKKNRMIEVVGGEWVWHQEYVESVL